MIGHVLLDFDYRYILEYKEIKTFMLPIFFSIFTVCLCPSICLSACLSLSLYVPKVLQVFCFRALSGCICDWFCVSVCDCLLSGPRNTTMDHLGDMILHFGTYSILISKLRQGNSCCRVVLARKRKEMSAESSKIFSDISCVSYCFIIPYLCRAFCYMFLV